MGDHVEPPDMGSWAGLRTEGGCVAGSVCGLTVDAAVVMGGRCCRVGGRNGVVGR